MCYGWTPRNVEKISTWGRPRVDHGWCLYGVEYRDLDSRVTGVSRGTEYKIVDEVVVRIVVVVVVVMVVVAVVVSVVIGW